MIFYKAVNDEFGFMRGKLQINKNVAVHAAQKINSMYCQTQNLTDPLILTNQWHFYFLYSSTPLQQTFIILLNAYLRK